MAKMLTRSSARQAQDSQSRETETDDDSGSDCGNETVTKSKSYTNKNQPLNRRTEKRVTRSSSYGVNVDNKMYLVPLKERKSFYNKVLVGHTKGRRATVNSSSTDLTDDSDSECKSWDRIPKLLTPRKQKSEIPAGLDYVSCVSPPKQRKINNDNIASPPSTPQHHENDQSEVQTPSRLLMNLNLTSPKQTKVDQKVTSNRKQLFKETKDEHISVENDKHFIGEKPKKQITSVYQSARKALHSAFPTDMPGREKELTELKDVIKTHIENKTPVSLYISGPPGTGKTASLNIILQEENISSQVQKVYVNCTAIKSPTAIFSRIAKELGMKINGKTERDYSTGVENYIRKQTKMILLVLDEIDQLESKNQSILYTIFEWPSKPDSKFILVGIANALDLTDRTLPRLQARCELKPKLMHFPPYTKQQIVQIFTSRLKSAGVLDVFSPVALQMLAGKVAAVSGDVRRALDIGRRVVELVDRSRREETLQSIENLADELVDGKPKTVELKQVVDVLNNVYGTSQNLSDDVEDSFPLQQKIVICSLILMLKKARNKDVTVGRLHEVYKRVCSKRNILSVDQAEFVGLCSLIETRGIIRVTGKKEPRLHKVSLMWDEEEVAASLKDKQLMSTILQDDGCLGKL